MRHRFVLLTVISAIAITQATAAGDNAPAPSMPARACLQRILADLDSADGPIRNAAVKELLDHRADLVRQLHNLIGYGTVDSWPAEAVGAAMGLLGDIPAKEEVPILVDHLTFQQYPHRSVSVGSRSYLDWDQPQLYALTSIGLQSLPALVKEVARTDSPEVTRCAARALMDTLGDDFAWLYADGRRQREPDEKARGRLTLLAAAVRRVSSPATYPYAPMHPKPAVPRLHGPSESSKSGEGTLRGMEHKDSTNRELRTNDGGRFVSCAAMTGRPCQLLVAEELPAPHGPEALSGINAADVIEGLTPQDYRRRRRETVEAVRCQQQAISSRLAGLVNVNWRNPARREVARAATLLLPKFAGEERNRGTVVFVLARCIAFTTSPAATTPGDGQGEFDRMPAVCALIEIGLPSLDQLTAAVADTDDRVVLERSAIVIDEVLGTEFAVLYVQDREHRQADPVKRSRLALLERRIDITERNRKYKWYWSPLQLQIGVSTEK